MPCAVSALGARWRAGAGAVIGIGGDPVVGTGHIDCLAAFQDDPDTDLIALIGEIGEIGEDRRRRGGTRRRPHP
ncbi:hypothetical protein GCM10010238_33380 [Streptomyces griseoviridis]|uniref:Uncharacterized protein n=1 Tax=Streptomyces griseoviridis TaxID=45398 RepID=A0A918LFV1_STRGD|nr:hypothetical protein GCM10010238_33380 [Streptomyces niveoruber]GGS96266.1 hypothetical protein GCM10010240_32030 [Streptomyces griseoviridis]